MNKSMSTSCGPSEKLSKEMVSSEPEKKKKLVFKKKSVKK